jgi:uncharacterized membrane protein
MDVLSHWIHIVFAAVALGGMLYGGFVLGPSMTGLPNAERAALAGRVANRFRPIALAALALLLISGSYNLFRAIERGVEQAKGHIADSRDRAAALIQLALVGNGRADGVVGRPTAKDGGRRWGGGLSRRTGHHPEQSELC